MTGIYGTVGEDELAGVEALGRRLAHRGGEETVWTPAPGVGFGWRSRAPLGSAGWGQGGRRAPLIFSGSVANRAELAALLGREPGGASPAEDAALLWALFRDLGPDAFARINGQFACALLDPATGDVILAGDRWAAQPLYYATAAGAGHAFASEVKALLALDRVAARPHRDALGCIQATKYLPNGASPLAGICPVPPNGWVRLAPGVPPSVSYYPRLSLAVVDRPEEAHVGELRRALLAAARRAVDGVDRVGIGLSSGLDSAVTVGAVRAARPGLPIHTYTASFDPGDPDLARAAEVARHFGTVHHEIVLAPEDLPRLLPQLVWHMEDPICREEMVVYHELTRRAARDVPLVLYGQMADVLFGGMPRHLLLKLAGDLPYLARPLMEFYDYTQTGAAPASAFGRLLVTAYYRNGQTAPARVLGASGVTKGGGLETDADESLNRSLLASIAAGPTEVAAMERLHAAVGLKYGSIFHDQEVAECAFRIPGRLKIRGRTRKYILRRAAEGFLPKDFASRPKGMIRVGQNERLYRVVDAMADELLGPEAVARRGLFDPGDVERLRRRGSGGYTHDQFYHVWTLLLIEIWARTFLDDRGRGPIILPGHQPGASRPGSETLERAA